VAHLRKPLGVALALNTAVSGIELIGGIWGGSLSLVTDAVHNLSDEVGLSFLRLAYLLRPRLSRGLLRGANLLHSVGLLAISLVLATEAIERLRTPQPVPGLVLLVVALLASVGNWAVARSLRSAGREDAAIHLAYVHNRADAWVSLGPALAGGLILASGVSLFDALVALGISLAILVPSFRSILESRRADLARRSRVRRARSDGSTPREALNREAAIGHFALPSALRGARLSSPPRRGVPR
jgi:cobalt-zinc-cadmium efflux system protein